MMPETNRKTIRVFIIDDHAIVRSGLRMLVESHANTTVVGEAGNSAETFKFFSENDADIILLDIDLGVESGLSFLPRLLETAEPAKVLVLTGIRDQETHQKAVALGALGLVLKDQACDTLINAIEKVYSGEAWLDPSLVAAAITQLARTAECKNKNPDPEALKIASLTEREREVVALIGEGLSNKLIGDRLFISEKTVRHHLTSIFDKLGLSDRFELAIYAFRHGLAQLPK